MGYVVLCGVVDRVAAINQPACAAVLSAGLHVPVPLPLLPVPLPLQADLDMRQLGVSRAESTPADWAKRAVNLMQSGNLESAASCWEKAGDQARAKVRDVAARFSASARSPGSRLEGSIAAT